MRFEFEVKDINNSKVVTTGTKELYNTDNELKASQWVRENVPVRGGTHDYVKLSSALVSKGKHRAGTMIPGALGYLYSHSNIVENNPTGVAMFSTTFADGHGVSILPNNFARVCMLFSARKLIKADWLNGKDEYLAPNEKHEKFAEFSYDSIIYSHFHGSSNQSSLRGIEYDGEGRNVLNEFFYMREEDIKDLADENSNQEVYSDIIEHGGVRFTQSLIEKIQESEEVGFSEEAQKVLDIAIEITKKSFKYRKEFNIAEPKYHINAWDAGWYQVRGLVDWVVKNNKDTELAELQKNFKESFAALSTKMGPAVFELGFLPAN